MANKILVPSEAQEQKALCQWLDKQNIRYFATAMGVWFGKPNPAYINSLKQRGFKNGVPDLVLLFDNGVTAFIELKKQKGGKVSEAQKQWIGWLQAHEFPAKVCNGAREAIKFIIEIKGQK